MRRRNPVDIPPPPYPDTPPPPPTVACRCAACGLPGHRYGRNEGRDRFDPQACLNMLRNRLAEVTDAEVDAAVSAWENAMHCAADDFDVRIVRRLLRAAAEARQP